MKATLHSESEYYLWQSLGIPYLYETSPPFFGSINFLTLEAATSSSRDIHPSRSDLYVIREGSCLHCAFYLILLHFTASIIRHFNIFRSIVSCSLYTGIFLRFRKERVDNAYSCHVLAILRATYLRKNKDTNMNYT